jgi:antitoxin FitA
MLIRKIEGGLKMRLRIRAAQNGRSMEEEVRVILATALAAEPPPPNLAAAIRARVEPIGGIELTLPERDPMRPPPEF